MVTSKPKESAAAPASAPAKRQVEQPFVPEQTSGLSSYPPPEKWDDWVEFEPRAWPEKREHHYMLVPTTCFNCESACGLMAYVDKETLQVRKLEGNPFHPGSRGRNCAKGPATLDADQRSRSHSVPDEAGRPSGFWSMGTSLLG